MSTPKKRPGQLTQAVYRFLTIIVADGLVREENAPPGFYQMPEGNAGVRVSNAAHRLGVLVIVGGYVGGIDKVKARALLREHDKGTLPDGAVASMDGRVSYKTRLLGTLRRSGASRGTTVRWYVDSTVAGVPAVAGDFGDRIEAARAICKAAGIELPGEDAPAEVSAA